MRYRDVQEPYPQPRPSLGKRLGRFVTLIGAIFAIAAAVIVTQRLSRDSLALLIGLSCGIMAMLPTFALGVFIWRREERRREERAQRQPAYPAAPPVIVVSPQAMPGYPGQHALTHDASADWQWATPKGQREFTIMGGED